MGLTKIKSSDMPDSWWCWKKDTFFFTFCFNSLPVRSSKQNQTNENIIENLFHQKAQNLLIPQ